MDEAITVCVVDDDERVRGALVRLLAAGGFKARAYGSGQALLAEASRCDHTPSVVLTDLRMPGMDGIALAEHLADMVTPPPVVFLTAHGDIPSTVRAMKDGAVDFLEKPVNEDALFDALRRAGEQSVDRLHRVESLEELRTREVTLTPRERQVFALVVSGLINKETAWELGVTEKTIKVHRGRVVHKMRASSLPDLVRMAERLGVLTEENVPPAAAP